MAGGVKNIMSRHILGTYGSNVTFVGRQSEQQKQVLNNYVYRSAVLVLVFIYPDLCWPLDNGNETVDPKRDGLQFEGSIVEKLRILDEGKPSDFGIRNNCLNTNRIRRINFKDDKVAYVDVGRGRQVILTLADECRGIRHSGFVQKSRTNRLCARFDSFEIIDTGMRCRIESLEPHITLDNDDLAPE